MIGNSVVPIFPQSWSSQVGALGSTASRFVDRVKMYQERYNYHSPEPFVNHEDVGAFCGESPAFDTFFKKGMELRSANDEDLTIYNLFFKEMGNTPKGSVVEIGAFNGHQESNSHFFNKCLGWETLLIEGNSHVYNNLLENRPNAHRFHLVPTCTKEEEMANKTIAFYATPWTNAGLGDGSVETAFNEDKEWIPVNVPCGTFTQILLDTFPNGHVTFFSLDVEGSEPAVVGNIDFDKVFIEVMMIEHFNNFCEEKCKSRDEFRRIMEEAGYVRFSNLVFKSDLFVHPLSKYLQVAELASANSPIIAPY